MITAREVIIEAYREIGSITDAQSLDGTRYEIGVSLLNQVISQLNIEGYIASTMVQLLFVPTTQQLEYTMGVQGTNPVAPDISTQRPAAIRKVYYQYGTTSMPIEVPIVSQQDIWGFVQSTLVQGLPTFCSYRSDYPYGVLMFNCQPMAGASFRIVYDKAIPEVSENTTLEIPPEYRPALVHSLGYLLAVRNGRTSEVVVGLQSLRDEALDLIQRCFLVKTPLGNQLKNLGTSGPSIWNFGVQ